MTSLITAAMNAARPLRMPALISSNVVPSMPFGFGLAFRQTCDDRSDQGNFGDYARAVPR
jgi:hypothetical protein